MNLIIKILAGGCGDCGGDEGSEEGGGGRRGERGQNSRRRRRYSQVILQFEISYFTKKNKKTIKIVVFSRELVHYSTRSGSGSKWP